MAWLLQLSPGNEWESFSDRLSFRGSGPEGIDPITMERLLWGSEVKHRD